MLEDYQNKVCVVTGAASGIGKALCENWWHWAHRYTHWIAIKQI